MKTKLALLAATIALSGAIPALATPTTTNSGATVASIVRSGRSDNAWRVLPARQEMTIVPAAFPQPVGSVSAYIQPVRRYGGAYFSYRPRYYSPYRAISPYRYYRGYARPLYSGYYAPRYYSYYGPSYYGPSYYGGYYGAAPIYGGPAIYGGYGAYYGGPAYGGCYYW